MSVRFAGSWGVQFSLKLDQLKRVKAVLANYCPYRELLSTYNLIESRLVPPRHKMEDAVIEALNQKRSRPQTTKKDKNKDAPTVKRVNIVQQVSPLKTLPPPPIKVGEFNEAATDPASSSPPVEPKSRLTDNRAEHLVPYVESCLLQGSLAGERGGCALLC